MRRVDVVWTHVYTSNTSPHTCLYTQLGKLCVRRIDDVVGTADAGEELRPALVKQLLVGPATF